MKTTEQSHIPAVILLLTLMFTLIFPSASFAAAVRKNRIVSPQAEAASDTHAEKGRLTVRMVGDDLIHGIIYETCRQPDGAYRFEPLFAHVKDDIRSADIAIINQETIFVNDPALYSTFPCFGTPAELGHAIADAGFDVVAQATNHAMDRGLTGIADTAGFWRGNYPDILDLGIHDSPPESDAAYLTRNGIRVGFVNYTYGLNGLEGRRRGAEYSVDLLSDEDVDATVQTAAADCDLLIAILHAGTEYTYTPTAYQAGEIDRMIDDGAKIVLCSHPHVVEPYGMITTSAGNTGLVYYSLGNFISSQTKLPRLLGGMADFTVAKNADGVRIDRYDFVPLVTVEGSDYYTTYKLSDYTEETAAEQTLCAGASPAFFTDLWNSAAVRY